MIAHIEARRMFAGPWWLAIVVLEEQARVLIEPALGELRSAEIGPMRRAGTEGRMSLCGGVGTSGELRIAEIDANVTELTVRSYRHVAQQALDAVTQRLASRIEAAVAREIGTPAA